MSTIMADSNLMSGQQEVLSQENLLLMDETVKEVFGMMLGLDVIVEGEAKLEPNDTSRHEQTAIVGFAGIISGMCEITIGNHGSVLITGAMLGDPSSEQSSDAVCDALGELGNMLAGGWKNRIPLLGSGCSLSVPTVIEGNSYNLHRPANAKLARRSYTFA